MSAATLYDLLPILVVAVALAAMAWLDRAERRAVRRWENRQRAIAAKRDEQAAFEDIVRRIVREDREP